MPRDFHRTKRDDCALIAAMLALVLLAGCTSSTVGIGTPSTASSAPASTVAATPDAPPPPPSSPASFKDKMAAFFSRASQKEPQPATNTTNTQTNVECPLIDIRQGASTLTIPPPPPDGSNEAMSLKYQGIFVRAARDCKVANGQLVMRVGVEGRIVVGPAGGPGQVDVPLRIAVVDQSPSNIKTIVTKLIRIPVAVGSDDYATFTHIEDELGFPLPPTGVDNYIVYIGFDPIGAAEEDKGKLKPAPKIKPKPRPKPTTPTG